MENSEFSYILRCVNQDMTSTNGFVWPQSGPVSCSDWDPKPKCGNGLHGWLNGEGNVHSSGIWDQEYTKFLVVKVLTSDIVDLKGKVKFPKGEVVFCGTRFEAASEIRKLGSKGAIHWLQETSGDYGTSISGDYGTSTSRYRGTSISGDNGTSTSRYGGISTSGFGGTSISGDNGTSTSGFGGTSTSGDNGTSISGYGGTSTSGLGGTSISGDNGKSVTGCDGVASSGVGGTIHIDWFDGNRIRTLVGYIGEDGLLPIAQYKVEAGKFVLA